MKSWLAGLSAITVAFATAAPALAAETTQTTPGSTPGMQGAPSAATQSVSEEELKTFAVAALKVREIGAEWQPKIAEAASEEQAVEIKTQARDEMVDAVQDEGLTVERYNEITQQVRANPELAQKVTTHMRETQ